MKSSHLFCQVKYLSYGKNGDNPYVDECDAYMPNTWFVRDKKSDTLISFLITISIFFLYTLYYQIHFESLKDPEGCCGRMKKNFTFIFYLVAGIIIGSLLAAFAQQVSWLSWLAFGTPIGFGADNPAVIDLAVLRLTFGLSISVTVAHVITIGLAMFLYSRRGKR